MYIYCMYYLWRGGPLGCLGDGGVVTVFLSRGLFPAREREKEAGSIVHATRTTFTVGEE